MPLACSGNRVRLSKFRFNWFSLNDGLPYECNEVFTIGNNDGLIHADALLLIEIFGVSQGGSVMRTESPFLSEVIDLNSGATYIESDRIAASIMEFSKSTDGCLSKRSSLGGTGLVFVI